MNNAVADNRTLFNTKEGLKSSSVVFYVPVASPFDPAALAHAGLRAGYALKEAKKSPTRPHMAVHIVLPSPEFIPLVFFIFRDHCSHQAPKKHAKEPGNTKCGNGEP